MFKSLLKLAGGKKDKEPKEQQQQEGGESAGKPPKEDKPDYLDKGVAALGSKFGIKTDAKTNEKITDGARGFFEKSTGKKVPEKISN
ncbi:MAG: hypothetical protein M1839_002354 [Geoglossum umbratile]|nr:MAG: hypothetical protein M1839_002354 [Geoglossum umbratile]